MIFSQKAFTPLESPTPWGGDLKRVVGLKTPPFLTGFTLPEVLIMVVIISILISLSLPLGLDFYRSQQLETQTQGIIQTLRRAQLKAMSGQADANFGVYLTGDNYTLFQGDSYNTRYSQFDEVFYLPVVLTLSGLSEIVFSKFEGEPNMAGDITLKSDSETRTVNINEMGRISLQ